MKGMYFTLEAVVAVFLIMSIFLLLFLTPQTNPEIERSNVKNTIYKGLDALSSKGSLRGQVLNNNASGIKTDLQKFVPLNIQMTVALYNKTLNNVTAEVTDQPVDMVGVSYYIAGDVGNYTPKEIRVTAWGFE